MRAGLRNRSNGRKRISVAAVLATTALSSPSVAVAETPAPVFRTVDDHGVDLVTALPFVAIEEGGIGSGPGRISLQRIYAEGAGFVDNWTGGMFKVTSGSTVLFYVQVAGLSDTFTYAAGNGPYTNTKANGATLIKEANGKYLYTSSQGIQIEFDPTGANSATACPGADAGSCAIPISIVQPNGLKFTIAWQEDLSLGADNFRLSSVLSSAGYKLTASYVSNSIGAGPTPNPDWFKRATVTFDNNANHPATLPTISYAYPNSTTISVTDPANRTWTFTTNASGQLTGVKRPGSASNDISYTYTSGLVTGATKDGVAYSYGRVINGTTGTMTVTKPLSQTDVITWDTTLVRPRSFKDGNLHTTSYQYDTSGRLTWITAPEGNYVQLGYDARGNITTTTRVSKTRTGPTIVTSASFDATCTNVVKCNKPNSTTDARGKVTDYTYDPTHGGVTSIRLPAPSVGADRPETRFSYAQQTSAQGDPVYMLTGISTCATGIAPACVGTANESKASAIYNSNLLATSITHTDGLNTASLTAINAMTYDERGNVLTVDGPLSGTADTTAYKYDAGDQQIGVISPDPDGAGSLKNRAIRLTYRPDGQVSKEELGTTAGQTDSAFASMTAFQTIDIGYSSTSRPLTRKLSAGSIATLTQTSYDALGRSECTAVRMNTAVYGSLPSSACTLTTQGSFGPDRISQSIYDAANQVIQVNVALGTGDLATERTLTYTNNGLVGTLKDAENNLTTYVYDGLDRLSQTRFPTATPKGAGTSDATNYEQLTYENTQTNTRTSEAVASFRNRANETTAFAYDDIGRMTLKDRPGTELDVTYGYDNMSRITSATQTGNSLSFTWDAIGRRLSETGPQGPATSEWDLAGRRTKLTYPDAGLYVNYDYLVTGEVSAIRENGATSGVGVLATYGYNDLGNPNSLTFGNGASQAFTYDAVSRLASLTNDLSGTTNDLTINNIVNSPASQIESATRTGDPYAWTGSVAVARAYASNGLNQYTASGSIVPTYDTKGNLTSAGSTYYCYSSENLLTTAAANAACTSPSVTLGYDPALRLYQVVAGATTTRFGYDGVNMIGEYNASNVLQRRFVFAPGIDRPIVQYEGSGTSNRRFFGADERGSIVSVTDGSGALVNLNRYDEYGTPQSTNSGRFQYTGQGWLSELGMQYSKARIYSPTMGRFLQTDPIGYADSPNLYQYVLGDPVNLVDPLGLIPCEGICITKWIEVSPAVPQGGGNLDRIFAQDRDTIGDRKDGGGDEIVITAKRKTQKPTPCQISFLKDVLGRRGLPTAQIENLKFVSGLGPNANLFTRGAWSRAIAVTQGSTVYVQPGRFDEVANFRSPIGFEEAYHTAQFAQGGNSFYVTYATLWVGGWLSIRDGYNGDLYEAFAHGASVDMFQESQSFMCRS